MDPICGFRGVEGCYLFSLLAVKWATIIQDFQQESQSVSKSAVLNLKYTAVYYAHISMIKFDLQIRRGKVLRDLQY